MRTLPIDNDELERLTRLLEKARKTACTPQEVEDIVDTMPELLRELLTYRMLIGGDYAEAIDADPKVVRLRPRPTRFLSGADAPGAA